MGLDTAIMLQWKAMESRFGVAQSDFEGLKEMAQLGG